MLRRLFELLGPSPTGAEGRDATADAEAEIAAAALLLEAAHADDTVHVLEHAAVADGLARHLGLDAAGVEALLARAEAARRDAIDLQRFTAVLVRTHDERQRLAFAEAVWRVVFSDGELTADEGLLARKLGNLLDLRPEDVSVAIRRARGERIPPPGA